MLRYSIAELGRQRGRAKGTTAELPPVQARLAGEKEYYAALRSILAEMAKEARESIVPLYQADMLIKRTQRALTGDADPFWFSRLSVLRMALVRIASNTVDRILNLEGLRHTENFMAAAKRALGIDLRAVVRQEDIEAYVREAVGRNTSLIQGFADDLQKRIEQTVYSNGIAGNSVATLRKSLQEQFGFSDRRAKLIARDQMGKFNSDLNRIRQTQAGLTSYVWSTSHDERVRERHRKLDGKTYKWGEATGAEQGLPPGQPVQCRCIARGVVEF